MSLNSVSDATALPSKNSSSVPLSPQQSVLTTDEYEVAHGEKLSRTLDLDTWRPGTDLIEMYDRLEREINEALQKESVYQKEIRKKIFPLLSTRSDSPPGAGVYRVSRDRLVGIHRKLLFNGAVEACDGTVVSHDTLAVTVTQIGVCLVSYQGNQGSWVQRLFRRDLRTASGKDPVEETMEILERRSRRGAIDQSDSQRPSY